MVSRERRGAHAMKVLAFPKDANKSNPYTSLLYAEIEKQGIEVEEFDITTCNDTNEDIVHVHWPEWFLGRRNPIAVAHNYHLWIEFLRAAKEKGTKIVWTVHNLKSHEKRHDWISRRFWREFRTLVDGYVCLSESTLRFLPVAGEEHATCVIPHGHYRDAYPMKATRETAREKLDIDSGLFLAVHVGLIREYKNVPELIRTFRETKGDSRLIVAGEVFDPRLRKRIELAAEDPRVKLKLKRVADDDVQFYFRAADLAVFPYRDILNSGSALMALSFDTPILVPGIGSMPELREQVGRDWVMTYQGDLSAAVLEEARYWALETKRPERAPLDAFEWDGIAKKTVEFYNELLAR